MYLVDMYVIILFKIGVLLKCFGNNIETEVIYRVLKLHLIWLKLYK